MPGKKKTENKILPLEGTLVSGTGSLPFITGTILGSVAFYLHGSPTPSPGTRILTSPPCAQETKIRSLSTFKGKGAESNQACSSKPVPFKSPLVLVKGTGTEKCMSTHRLLYVEHPVSSHSLSLQKSALNKASSPSASTPVPPLLCLAHY